MTKILAINAGSSSLKFQLFVMPAEELTIKGLFERIGLTQEVLFSCTYNKIQVQKTIQASTHQDCIQFLCHFLLEENIISSIAEIEGVGHRVAHGGEFFKEATVIDQRGQEKIQQLSHLAPLHNPANLMGIQAFQDRLPGCPQVGVFDTAFHQSMPEKNYIYPIPYHFYKNSQIRRYGFHGTSHQYVAEETAKLLKQDLNDLALIVCHIGNGASLCGIKSSQSVVTSMGFTPLAGTMMGTRCGDIDPSIVSYLQETVGYSAKEVLQIMNEQSGLLGTSGISSDLRDVVTAAQNGHKQAELSLDMYATKIRQTIGAYATELGHLDALIFTAGVGENSSLIRSMIVENLGILGIKIAPDKNQTNALFIEANDSKVKVLVVPTNEELMIAKETYQLVRIEKQNSEKKYHILNKSAI